MSLETRHILKHAKCIRPHRHDLTHPELVSARKEAITLPCPLLDVQRRVGASSNGAKVLAKVTVGREHVAGAVLARRGDNDARPKRVALESLHVHVHHDGVLLHCILPSTKAPKSTTLPLLDLHMLPSNSMMLLCKGRQINSMSGMSCFLAIMELHRQQTIQLQALPSWPSRAPSCSCSWCS